MFTGAKGVIKSNSSFPFYGNYKKAAQVFLSPPSLTLRLWMLTGMSVLSGFLFLALDVCAAECRASFAGSDLTLCLQINICTTRRGYPDA